MTSTLAISDHPKAKRSYALSWPDHIIPGMLEEELLAFDLDYALAESLRSQIREAGFKTVLRRHEPGVPPRLRDQQTLRERINCHWCGHALQHHPRVGFGQPGHCISCYLHDLYEDGRDYWELPVCTRSEADVLYWHLNRVQSGQPVWVVTATMPYYGADENGGRGVIKRFYVSSNAQSYWPIPIASECEARVVAEHLKSDAWQLEVFTVALEAFPTRPLDQSTVVVS